MPRHRNRDFVRGGGERGNVSDRREFHASGILSPPLPVDCVLGCRRLLRLIILTERSGVRQLRSQESLASVMRPMGLRDLGRFDRLLFDVLDRDEFDDCEAVLFPGDDLEVSAEVVKVKESFEVGAKISL